jgi:hypothetical protein
MQAIDFVAWCIRVYHALEGLVEERMLIGFKLVFLFSNGRDFFLANFEKFVSLFISLESFSFLNWRKLNI